MPLSRLHPVVQNIIVTAAVVAAGGLGELLLDLQSQVTLVRPASGVALAAALLWGVHIWPGAALGSVLLHLAVGDPLAEVLLVPLGNTLSLLLGTALLRWAGLAHGLDRVRDVLALAVLGAMVSPLPAAFLGALGHPGHTSLFLVTVEWWLGDAMGILVVCPALLCWSARERPWLPPRSGPEPHVWLFGLLAATVLAHGDVLPASVRHPQLPFIVFPFLCWAALRFDQRTTTGALLLISAVAVTTTGLGLGPFARAQLQTGLIYLMTYLAVVSLTTLLLSAVILERAGAEENLRESEQRFRTLAEQSDIGFSHLTSEGKTVYVNPALCELLEATDPGLLHGDTFLRCFTPESQARVRAEHARRLRGESTTYEAELVGLKGGRRSVIVSGVPLMRPDGQLHGTIATLTDITQRRKAEETLRTSQEMLRLVLDNIPLFVFWKDTHCVYLGCNNNAARIAGLNSPEEIVGKTDFELPSTEEEAAHFQEWDRRVMDSDKPEYRIIEPLHLPNGTLGWLETTKVPLHDEDGKVIGLLGLFEDITERKKMETALRTSEQRFRTLIEYSWDGISVADAQGRLIYSSPSVARISGTDANRPPGENILKGVHPEDLSRAVSGLAHVLEEPGRTIQGELRVRHANGQWIWLECVSRNLLHEPTVAGIVTNFRDVTERKRAEEELRRHQEELIHRQAREKELVEAELARVRDQVVRTTRLTTLGQMAASVAHELRNPLGAIRNAVYLLRRRGPALEERWSKYLDIVDQEITASNRIITNLLELSRPKEPMRERIELSELVRDVFRRLHPPPDVQWSMTSSPEPFILLADKVQLRQVLDNLIKNALDAAGTTGAISVDARECAGYAIIVIQDDGPGVPPDQRVSLFEPLFSTKVKGTGLGLYISRQIAERHGGSLDLVDSPRGAVFRLRLPLAQPEGMSGPNDPSSFI